MPAWRLRRPISAAIAILLAAACPGWLASQPSAEALTNEMIVRMVISGASEAEILERINTALKVEFDLDQEVLEEMRLVGVSDAVIAAMRKRVPGAGEPERTTPPAAGRGRMELSFAIDPNQETWRSSIAVPPRTPAGNPVSLALFVLCTDPTHVPDAWQTRTPLPEFPRHEKLWFVEGAQPAYPKRKNSPLYAPLPGPVTLDLEAGRHLLLVGAAGREGTDPWVLLASDAGSFEIRQDQCLKVEVVMRTTGSASSFPRPGAKSPYSVKLISR